MNSWKVKKQIEPKHEQTLHRENLIFSTVFWLQRLFKWLFWLDSGCRDQPWTTQKECEGEKEKQQLWRGWRKEERWQEREEKGESWERQHHTKEEAKGEEQGWSKGSEGDIWHVFFLFFGFCCLKYYDEFNFKSDVQITVDCGINWNLIPEGRASRARANSGRVASFCLDHRHGPSQKSLHTPDGRRSTQMPFSVAGSIIFVRIITCLCFT